MPKTCAPVWTGAGFCDTCPMSSAAVAGGVVYVGEDGLGEPNANGNLYAFDAAGVSSCSGSPPTCAPLWSGTTHSVFFHGSPAVANGVVYVSDYTFPALCCPGGRLRAFDARGVTGCSGSPKRCTELWSAEIGPSFSSPAVARGVVYIGSNLAKLYALDAAGVTGCSGSPKTCAPLWTAPMGDVVESSPAVANGVVYTDSNNGNLYAFDAAGGAGCS